MADAGSQLLRRVLIFGGTFDPPHVAHADLPAKAAEQLSCDLILYVPAAQNPLKSDGPVASNEHRMAMLLLAIADVPQARISTIELDRAGPSFTVDTLHALKSEFESARKAWAERAAQQVSAAATSRSARPAAQVSVADPQPSIAADEDEPLLELRLLIGCDQALEFHRWHKWQEILTLVTPAVMVRPPWTGESFDAALGEKYSKVEADSWRRWTLRLPRMDVNSSAIRQRLLRGEFDSLERELDPAVLKYIMDNRVYG